MNYSQYITSVVTLLDMDATLDDASSATPTTVDSFNNMITPSIAYAENRIQRQLDLENTYVTDLTGSFVSGTRNVTLPTSTGIFVVATQIFPIISGVKQLPLLPMSLEGLNMMYPSDTPLSSNSVPVYWAPYNQTSILVGPSPDLNYGLGVVGTQRLTPMSSTNISNFLSLYLPDVYLAASMVFWFGYQRDYGSQSDDPKAAQSWEQQYQLLISPALVEEKRKMFQSVGWSARLPSPVATPPQS